MCTCTTHQNNMIDLATVALLLFLLSRFDRSTFIDERSGLLMYDAWRTQAAPILARPRGNDDYCALLITDIDNFKSINDEFGHLAGDSVIEAVAGVLRDETDRFDVAGRFGGDEFVVLIDRLEDRWAVEPVAERIRKGVADLAVRVEMPDRVRIITGLTVSIGGALHSAGDGPPDLTALVWAADGALYSAKRAGRNTVRIDQPVAR